MAKRTISGSRAIVTGASSGIGRAIALELGRHGADVVLMARSAEKLQRVAGEFNGLPGRATISVGDVTDSAARHAALHVAQETFGGVDILVNNAGIGALGPFETATAERLRHVMEVNFFAVAEMTRAALPVLRHGRRPLVVNVSSILGRRGIPQSSDYCASKFALEGLSQSQRAEFHRIGVDLLVVAPGTTDTEFFDHAVEVASRPPWLGARGVSAEKVAQATVRAMAAGRREIVPNFQGWLLCLAQRLAPGIVDRVMRRYG